MNSFNFQVVSIDTITSIQTPFPDHICYFTEDTENYYIWKDDVLKEIFVDDVSVTWNSITNTPTTITGYGITDAVKSNNGTLNYVAKFTPDGNTIGNSQIKDDGTNVTIGAPTDVDSLVTVNTQTLSNALFSSSKKTTGTNRGLYGEAIGNGASFNYGLQSYATGANLNIGVNTKALGTGTVIGIKAEAQGTGSKYSIQLQDGTEASGKFLKSVTGDGKANWANITVSDVQGSVSSLNGTNNYVAKFTPNGTTIGNSQIQDDGLSIGFGTSPNSLSYIYTDQTNSNFAFTAFFRNSDSTNQTSTALVGQSNGSKTSGQNIGVFGKATSSGFENIGVIAEATSLAGSNSTNYGLYSSANSGNLNYGVYGISSSSANKNIGLFGKAINATLNYSIQLQDGTEAAGKFLKSVTADGEANWASITTSDIQGGVVGGSGTVNYLSKWTPDGSTLGDSQIQDDGDTIGFGISPNPDISYYFSSTDKPVGKWFVHSYTGSDSVVSSDIELSGTVSTFNKEAIGYGVTNLISNLSGNGKNYGIKGTVSGADINIGASFTATGGANAYAIELKDGTQAAGKFLKSVTGDGKANWANITTADIQGYQASSFSLSESKAIYVDATYGNNTTGTKYDPSKPFLTWSAALAVAVTGDWIVFNAGTYTQAMTPTSNINVYCKPGVIFSGVGFTLTASTTWRLHGYAVFNDATPLSINSTGGTHDIYFQFDRTTGLCSFGVICSDLSAQMLMLKLECNYIVASTPIRINNGASGATYEVVINVSQKISGYGSITILFPSNFAYGSIFGTVVINCPIIENTNSGTARTNLWTNMTNNDNFQLFINSSLIKVSSTSYVESGVNNIVSAIWYDGGDNININSDIDAGVAPAIVSRSVGATYHTGNMTITGNIFSQREIVQHYTKVANGNGWHNIIIKNGFIHSKGLGASDSMFHRDGSWNSVHWGTPGNVQLVNCTIYNQNANASASASIVRDDLSDVGKNNNFQLYNCLAFIETGGYLATSAQATKYISAHNIRTNRPLNTTVTDGFSPSGVIVDTNLTIPKTNINV